MQSLEEPIITDAAALGVISTAKQARIDVWRNEVASALLQHAVPPPPSSRSTYSSLSSSTNQSSSSFLPSLVSRRRHTDVDPSSGDSQRPASRVRRIWSRIERHFSGHIDDIPGYDPEALGGDGQDEAPRTAMYASLLPPPLDGTPTPATGGAFPHGHVDDDGQVPLGDDVSDGGPGGSKALREKQERLQRAARLLSHGAEPKVLVHAA